MTDEAKALVERLRDGVLYGDARLHNPKGHNPLFSECADLIETQAREIERLREALEKIAALTRVRETRSHQSEWTQNLARAALAGDSHDQ